MADKDKDDETPQFFLDDAEDDDMEGNKFEIGGRRSSSTSEDEEQYDEDENGDACGTFSSQQWPQSYR